MIPDSNFKPTPPQKNPRKQNAIIKLRTYIHITTLFKMPKEEKMKFKKKKHDDSVSPNKRLSREIGIR